MITWDAAYESEITNATYIFQLDNKLRELKQAIRERFEKEHQIVDGQHIPGKVRVLLYDTEANISAYVGFNGAIGFSSDTKKLMRCIGGANWVVKDLSHANFSGLLIDDHAIYLKADGTRALAGDLSANGFKITDLAEPTLSGDLANKLYVDEKSALLTKDVLYQSSASSVIYSIGNWITALSMTVAINNTEDKVKLSGFALAAYNFSAGAFDETVKARISIGGVTYAYGQKRPVQACLETYSGGFEPYQIWGHYAPTTNYDSSPKPTAKSISLCCYITGLGVGNRTVLLEINDGSAYSGVNHVAWFNRAIQAYVVRKV